MIEMRHRLIMSGISRCKGCLTHVLRVVVVRTGHETIWHLHTILSSLAKSIVHVSHILTSLSLVDCRVVQLFELILGLFDLVS